METGPTHARAMSKILDMYNPPLRGEPVLASHDGRVIRSLFDNGLGHNVVVQHSSGYYSLYAHLLDRRVSVGQNVTQGQLLGHLGDSGEGGHGVNHLHYEQHYDYDGDGWDYLNEWVYPVFNGVEYRLSEGGQPYSTRVISNNCPATGRTQFADIDGDGRDEILSIAANGDVTAYRNRGWDAAKVYDGPDSRLVAQGFSDPARVRFADIDGDGRDEILSIAANGDVTAYRNQGWAAAKVYDGPNSKLVAQGFSTPQHVKFADIDGDGRDEILTVNGDVVAYRNLGWDAPKVYDGSNSKLVAQGFSTPQHVKFADIDGDGRDEILTVNGDVTAYRNLGWTAAKVYDGPASKVVAQGFSVPARTHFAEINGDGRAEILSIGANGDVVAYRNLGWDAPKVYDGPDSKLVAQGFTE
ncbi:FG-GAP-like repeat-containing protein [Thermoactinospora rubra]|uniref:FG-GAP-like repeat-containing protein n=1 Tax=Thermoactinospora rubra TaxID=1088767 RepID=UPI001301C7F3|nr:FG-GAP-like repeat-containing protein [Thermoactinospora rubra]